MSLAQLRIKVVDSTQKHPTPWAGNLPWWIWVRWCYIRHPNHSLRVIQILEMGIARGLCPKNVYSPTTTSQWCMENTTTCLLKYGMQMNLEPKRVGIWGRGGGIVFAYLSKHLCTSLSNFNSDILANHGNLGYNPSLHYKPINSTPPFNMLITPHRKPPNIHSINHTTMCNTINKYTFEFNPFLPIWLQPWYTPTSNNQPSQLPQKPSTPSCPPPPHA